MLAVQSLQPAAAALSQIQQLRFTPTKPERWSSYQGGHMQLGSIGISVLTKEGSVLHCSNKFQAQLELKGLCRPLLVVVRQLGVMWPSITLWVGQSRVAGGSLLERWPCKILGWVTVKCETEISVKLLVGSVYEQPVFFSRRHVFLSHRAGNTLEWIYLLMWCIKFNKTYLTPLFIQLLETWRVKIACFQHHRVFVLDANAVLNCLCVSEGVHANLPTICNAH